MPHATGPSLAVDRARRRLTSPEPGPGKGGKYLILPPDFNGEKPRDNADGSIDIYFGAKAPAGKEGNWIAAVPGKGFFVIFRLYGPLEPWYDKSWRLGEPEVAK